jgi:hypothetical protein
LRLASLGYTRASDGPLDFSVSHHTFAKKKVSVTTVDDF